MVKEKKKPEILGYTLVPDWRDKEIQTLSVPISWEDKPISTAFVDGNIMLYVETRQTPIGRVGRRVMVLRSGQELSPKFKFIGTVVNGPYAWHVCVETRPAKKEGRKKSAKKKVTKNKIKATKKRR